MNNINHLIKELNKEVSPKGKILLAELLDLIVLELKDVRKYIEEAKEE